MDIRFVTKGNVSDEVKDEIRKRLDMLWDDKDAEAKVSLSCSNGQYGMSVMLVYEGKLIKVSRNGRDIGEVMDGIESALRSKAGRVRSKAMKRAKDQEAALLASSISSPEEPEIVKRKRIRLDAMSPEEAIGMMEELGHESYIFLDSRSGSPCMVYARNDGRYGLIEAVSQ